MGLVSQRMSCSEFERRRRSGRSPGFPSCAIETRMEASVAIWLVAEWVGTSEREATEDL